MMIFFPKQDLTFHAKCLKWKSKKNTINLSSAEFSHSMLNVKQTNVFYHFLKTQNSDFNSYMAIYFINDMRVANTNISLHISLSEFLWSIFFKTDLCTYCYHMYPKKFFLCCSLKYCIYLNLANVNRLS